MFASTRVSFFLVMGILLSSFVSRTVLSFQTSPHRAFPITRRRAEKLRAIVGLDAPDNLVTQSERTLSAIDEVDYVVIGSGIGGLSCAALLTYYGYEVIVLESHYLAGDVVFDRSFVILRPFLVALPVQLVL